MTYDPLSYGQGKMGGNSQAAADAPDDILFANGAQPPADASWGLLDEDVGSLWRGGGAAPVDFGSDLPGAARAAPPAAAPVRARPAPKPRPTVATPTAGRSAAPTPPQRPALEPAPIAPPVRAPVAVRRPANVRLGPGSRLGALLVPAVVFVPGRVAAARRCPF